MSGNVNRGLVAASIALLITAAAAPTAQAVSDEVAVQLLERLGELEKEVSSLRGENETLLNELESIKKLQREGFLEVDERVSGLEKPLQRPLVPVPVTPSEPTRVVNPIELPALEDPVMQQEFQPSAIAQQPLDLNISVSTADRSVPNPEDRRAVAPAVEFSASTMEKVAGAVDPTSPEGYYFYGTEDKNQDKAITTSTAVDKKTVPVVASKAGNAAIPDAHKAKAEYNQSYKALVNDPGSAVPAFRAFLVKYPDHELAANAQYWLGEALYAQKDYSGATEEFMVVLKNHKASPKAPGAALKLGYSFYELKQWDFARRTLEDTIRFFPDSNAAVLAKQRLEKITTEGH